jgi:CheY-like chemotaxis protein
VHHLGAARRDESRNYERPAWALLGALEATSPAEALDLCCNNRDIDLLICDVELGLVSGMEPASVARASIPHLRAILLCDTPCECWSERENAELNELPSDAVVILEKPFRPVELRAAIGVLIGVREAVPVEAVGT